MHAMGRFIGCTLTILKTKAMHEKAAPWTNIRGMGQYSVLQVFVIIYFSKLIINEILIHLLRVFIDLLNICTPSL